MTSMQNRLYPPLVDDDDNSYDGVSYIHRQESSTNNNNNGSGESTSASSSNVLSRELNDRFESMRSLLRNKNLSDAENNKANLEMKRKQKQMALETALLVESEISRLESGIAELEALLYQQQQQRRGAANVEPRPHQHQRVVEDENGIVNRGNNDGNVQNNANNPVLIFPYLPSIIAPDEDDVTVSNDVEDKNEDDDEYDDCDDDDDDEEKDNKYLTNEEIVLSCDG